MKNNNLFFTHKTGTVLNDKADIFDCRNCSLGVSPGDSGNDPGGIGEGRYPSLFLHGAGYSCCTNPACYPNPVCYLNPACYPSFGYACYPDT